MVAVALSLAGSDPSGGAGIQADLKTFHQHGVYGCAIPTLLTVQNTQRLSRVVTLDATLVAEQLDAVLEDLPVAAAKTGALGSAAIASLIAERFATRAIPLVVDPVRLAKHGAALTSDESRTVLLERLMRVAALITPNADEAAWLLDRPVLTLRDAEAASEALIVAGARAVLLKGGHLDHAEAIDVLHDGQRAHVLRAPRVETRHTHGLGCTLSAAITAELARGRSLLEACTRAKHWLSRALTTAPGLGSGIGPLDHFAPVDPD